VTLSRRLVWRVTALLLALWAQFLASPALAQEQRVTLADSDAVVEVWPSVTILEDASKRLTIEQILATSPVFTKPKTAYGTLGMRRDAVWLHIPVAASNATDGDWILDIDYPVINRIDVFVVSGGVVGQRATLGNLIPRAQKPLDSRANSCPLKLGPGEAHDIYLRVINEGSMILPTTLQKPVTFHRSALDEQMLQGVLAGIALCLLLYSLAQWLSLGEHLFVKYAILISGSLTFCLLQFGIGAQYIWVDNAWMEVRAGGLSAMVAATGSFLFIEQTLSGHIPSWLSKVMKAGAAVMTTFAVGYSLDWLDLDQVTAIVSTLGLAPALLGIPGAWRRARMGDRIGGYFLLAWAVYFVTTAILIQVIKGQLGANFWTLHSFQFGATVDMLVFMRVLGLRTKALQLAVQHTRMERDSLRVMAHTDPLTGLPNRRSLHPLLDAALGNAREGNLFGVYMLDLDGFKQINDRYGHAVGDELLVAVAKRLTATVRGTDFVARLGGDEFLVIARDLPNEQAAQELGEKLLRPFDEPFVVSHQTCRVGVTVGYALAPLDADDARRLLESADGAMYTGKQSGKRNVIRAYAA
jgi:diguanylate cyclase (GGDEF)-like protein